MLRRERFLSKAFEYIDSHRVISFDIFGTLLNRDCEAPEDVFALVEDRYNANHELSIAFKKCRLDTEKNFYRHGVLPTLDQIYDSLPLCAAAREELKSIEIDVEYQIIVLNLIGMRLYSYAKERGKEIIAISDMYLDANTLQSMLQKEGYSIDKIYVSCEYGVDKTHGQLFKIALEDKGISPHDIMHFGDSASADRLGAILARVQSMMMPHQKDIAYLPAHSSELGDRCMHAFVQNRLPAIEDDVEKLGYEVLGPLLYSFVKWLHEDIIKNDYDVILFCARDMLLTYELYTSLFPEEMAQARYFYVSIDSLTKPYNAVIGKDASTYAREQLVLLKQYLVQLGVTKNTAVALVDSGFSGRTQYMLQKIVGSSVNLHGYYLRVNNTFAHNIQQEKPTGFLSDNHIDYKLYLGADFIEAIISAIHGRTIEYEYRENSIEPIKNTSRPHPETLIKLQNGAKQFCIDYECSETSSYVCDEITLRKTINRLSLFPESKDIDKLQSIYTGDEAYKQIYPHHHLKYYLLHPMHAPRDLRACGWKGGFLTDCFYDRLHIIAVVYVIIGYIYLNICGESNTLIIESTLKEELLKENE